MPAPRIDQYKHDLPGVVTQAEQALADSSATPRLFQRGTVLALVLPAEPRPKQRIQRTVGSPLIRLCPASTLRLCLAMAATWTVPDKRSKSLESTMPQPWVVETLLNLGAWKHVPPLTGIIMAPTLRHDGTILDSPGYDEETGLLYIPGETTFPAIPTTPTKADALQAFDVLATLFQDFPFREPYDRSAAYAALFTALIRHAIPGFVPAFGVSAPAAGTGKTLFVDTVSTVATGRPAPKLSQPPTEEEWGKQLLACALEGDPLILIDNCTHTIASSELCKALTAEVIKGRILGLSKNGEAPQNAVYFLTGNNLSFRSDIVRRVIPITMESPLERPETRTGFTITDPLVTWARAQRPALVCAALTILRAYSLATDKPTVPTLGSFEEWCTMICGPLVWLGLANPIDGTADLKEHDEDREQVREFLLAWHAIYGGRSITLKQAKEDIGLFGQRNPGPPTNYDALFDALKTFDHSKNPLLDLASVGLALKKIAGRTVCGKKLTRGKTRTTNGWPWIVTEKNECKCVSCVSSPQPHAGSGSVTNTGTWVQKPTQLTQQGGQSGANANASNGLAGNVGVQGAYIETPPCLHRTWKAAKGMLTCLENGCSATAPIPRCPRCHAPCSVGVGSGQDPACVGCHVSQPVAWEERQPGDEDDLSDVPF
jgi:putative DNA primase/helicase